MKIKSLLLAISLLFFQSLLSAQTINIIRFNNTVTYYAGGSISIHINPTGVFALNNSFFLDLSDANGSFANPTTIATVQEFFTPVINATIPANTPAGTGYKLRVRASTAGVTPVVTSTSFSIVAAPNPTLSLPEITLSGVPLAQITCMTTTQNPPYIGWLNQSTGATTGNRTLIIAGANGSEIYNVTLVEMTGGTPTTAVLAVNSGQFTFPAGKITGYYVLEVERKKNNSNESTVRSFIYHFNTGLTNLGNSSSETVCINSSVLFNIDLDNIKYNYPGSKYVITYGDGSPSETYTHAQLLASPSLSHIFTTTTCSSPNATQNGANGYFFKVDIKLQNKGIGTGNCNTYVDNGNGTTKWVNTSIPPIADFTAPAYRCINTSFTVTNTSTFGAYGTGTTCQTDMYTVWKVKKPGQTNFIVVSEGPGRLNYTFPASEVNVAGCWVIRLEVSNLEGCLTVSSVEKTVGIEPVPTPNFNIIKGGVEVNTICNGETVTLTDNSNLLGLQCQNPTYGWSISPNSGFVYVGGTNSTSQNPQVTFNTPGNYTITQSITNSCGTFTIQKPLTVNGAPTVTAPTPPSLICKFSPADTVLDFSVAPWRPTYSTGNFAPTSYLWEVNGSSTPNADWEFSGGTSATSAFPKILFKTYRTYTIKITVNGGCGNGNATYTFDLRQRPRITNTPLDQRICSGATSQSFNLTSDMANTNFNWTTSISPTGSVGGVTTVTSGTTIPGSVLTNTTANVGTVTFAVTAANNGCSSTQDFKVFVHPRPPAPTTSPLSLCLGQTANPLTATALNGHSLQWYTVAVGGTSIPTPTPGTGTAGTTTYYVSQVSNTAPNCESNRASLVVTVNPINTAAAPSANPTLCVNTQLSPSITITTTGATGIGAVTGLPAGLTANWTNNTITISGTPTASGTFNYTIPLSGGCGTINATGTIIVVATNTAAAPSASPTICVNTQLSPNITINTTGATGIGTATGLPNGITASWNNNQITISGTPTASGTFNYSIPLTGGCGTVNATGTITVVASNTAAAPAPRTTCVNVALSPNITIATGGATGIGTATGLPNGLTATWSNNTITISGTPTATGTFSYSIPLTGGCGTVSATGSITVNATNTAAAPSANPSICINAPMSPTVTIATTGATGIGTATGLPNGLTATWSNNTITISGTPTAAGTFNYTIPLSGGCGTVNATGTITVLINTVSNASANPSLCVNTALTQNITFTTTGATGIGTATGLPNGVSASWNNNTITISGTPTAAGTFNYTIPLTGGCGTVNATGTITVVASNTAAAPAPRTTCVNVALSPNITITTAGATGIGTPTGLPAGLNAAWNNNTITISGTPTATGTFSYSIPLTGGCGTVSATGSITVNPVNTAAAPSANPSVCINAPMSPTVTIATTGATGIGTPTGLPTGVTATWNNNTITIGGTPTVAGTFNYSIPLTGGCGTVSATGTITVLINTVTNASATPSLCVNTTLSPDVTFTTTGATGIGMPTGLPAGMSANWNNNTITISGTPTATGTFNYSIPLTGGCGTVNATGTITVVASNTAAAPAPRTLCINTSLTPAITIATTGATGIGTPSGLPAGVNATWSNNIITISGTPTASGTFNYTIPLTGGCGTVSATGTITVNPVNTAAAPSANPSLCINTSLTPSITIATTGATGIGTATGLPTGVTATWSNNTITISGTPTVAGTFNYTIPLTGGCGTVSATGTITVLINTVSNASATPSICVNTALSPDVTFTTTGATGIGSPTNLPAGLTATWANNAIMISGTPTATGTFNYTIPLTGGCGNVNATGTITVVASNTAAAPAPRTLCINTALTPGISIATTGATGIGTATGLPTGVTATWSNNTITISGTPTAFGTFNYSIPLTGGCGTVSATGTITVNPVNTAATPSANPSLCINDPLTPITIATTGATGIGTPTGLPTGVTATLNNNTITISGTPTVAGTFNYSIPLTGGCGTVSATGTITVLVNTVSVASANPSLCVNTSLSPSITFTTTGATGIGSATNLPAGLTATWANNTITISGTPTATGTFNYTIPLTGGCGNINATGTITVVATNTAAAPSANPTLCINTALAPSITIATTGATGIGTPTGLPAGVNATWANNSITISGTPTASGTFSYTIPLTGGCGTVNATGTITVTPANTAATPSANPTLCINDQLTPITIATTGATGIGAAIGLPTGVTATWNNNTITISGTPSVAGIFNYSIPLTGGCATVTATGTITVLINTVTAPTPRSVCINEVLSPSITFTTTGATGIGAPAGLPAGLNAVWNNSTITISGTPTATGTFNYSIPLTGGCGIVNATGSITVIAANTAAAPAPRTICINTSLSPSITIATTGATGIGAATGLPAGVTATWNNNTITISGTPTASGTFNYSIPLTGGCGTVNATGTITVTPNNTTTSASSTPSLCINTTLSPDITFTTTGATGIGAATGLPAGVTATWNNNTITVSGTPTAAGTFNYSIPLTGGCGTVNATGTITVIANNTAAVPAPRTICINTALTPSITIATTGATGIGTPVGLPAGISATWSNDVITISGTATASGTFNYTIPLTGGCGAVSATGTIAVTAANTVAPPSANPTLCINSPLTPITIATTGSTGIGTPTGLPTGVTATWNNNTITISGTPSVAGTFNYTIPLTGGCGTLTATGTITVLINTVTAASANPSLCINAPLSPDVTFTTTGATGIGTPIGLPSGLTATWNNNTITISGTPTVAGVFNYSIPLTGGCGVVSATGTIDVKPRPIIQPTTVTICSGQTFTVSPTNGNGNVIPTGTTYTWPAPTTTGGMAGVAGTGAGISGTLTNATSAPQTATYTVTPAAANCPGNAFTVVVTVNPTPTIAFSRPNQTLCSGGTSQPVTITSPTTGVTIGWSASFPPGLTAVPNTTSGTTSIPSYVFTNSTANPITVSFVATVATGGTPACPGVGGTYTITVVPTPPPPATQSLVEYCHNDPAVALTATATPPNTLIWYSPPSYTPSTTAPIPSTATVGSFIYYVTQVSPTTPACESARATIEVRVKPIPQIAVSAVAPTTCNSNNGVMTITGLFPNTIYQLHYVVNTVVVNTTVTSNASGNIVINNLVGGIYRDIWVILNGCRSNVVAGPFNLVNPDVPATPDASSNSPICEGATLQLNAVSLTPNVTYEWTGPNGYTSSLSNPQIVNATVNRTGRYKVVARANGCVSEADSVDVVVHPNPTVNLGRDTALLPPATLVLNPQITNGPISQYTWTPAQNLSCSNCPNPTATVLSSITYQLTVRNNNGCIGRDDIRITALCERSVVYIPNAFVPNGGANSVFRIRSAGPLVVKHFRIFNRWGELIFERVNFPTNDAAYGWDGRVNGALVNPDVFVYTAEVQCENGSTIFFKGNVTLLR